MTFSGDVSRDGDAIVVHLGGELDEAALPEARRAFDRALGEGAPRLRVDVSGLRFMDSTGIWLLVEAQRRCLDAGTALHLVGDPAPPVARALRVAGVDTLLGERAAAPAPEEPVVLRLYVAGSARGGSAVVSALESLPSEHVEVEIIDVLSEPGRAEADRVVATPTLVKVRPQPELRLIGTVQDPAAVLRHLGLEHYAA